MEKGTFFVHWFLYLCLNQMTNKQKDKETEGRRDRQTEGQTDRQTNRQTKVKTEIVFFYRIR